MSRGWRWDPDRLRLALEAEGFDLDPTDPAPSDDGGSISARRDRAGRTLLVVLDAGGRFRAEITALTDEQGWSTTEAGVPLRVVTETRQASTATGILTDPDQLSPLLAAIDRLVPHGAGTTAGQSTEW